MYKVCKSKTKMLVLLLNAYVTQSYIFLRNDQKHLAYFPQQEAWISKIPLRMKNYEIEVNSLINHNDFIAMPEPPQHFLMERRRKKWMRYAVILDYKYVDWTLVLCHKEWKT